MDAEVVPALSRLADGDARAALNALELAVTAAQASSVPAGTATSPLPGSGATPRLDLADKCPNLLLSMQVQQQWVAVQPGGAASG